MTNNQNPVNSGNIPYDTLLALHEIYKQKKHHILSADLNTKQETREIWFELNQEMKDFLAEALKDGNVTGIRVYLMAYPDQPTVMDGTTIPVNPSDVSQLTVGLVTTKAGDGTGRRHVDYPESKNGTKMLLTPPMNHGELCPQQCN
jgi:hypothetical protein